MNARPLPVYYRPPARVIPAERETDCLIYGGTSAGVMAAVQLRRTGRGVIVVNPSGWAGGMTTSGLGYTDVGNRHAIGGLAAEFYRAVGAVYGTEWQTAFEPGVAARVLADFVSAHGVEILPWEFLQSVEMDGGGVRSATFESGLTVRARMFLDATYEGDLAAMARVPMTIGREPSSLHREEHNGCIVGPHHQFPAGVDPWVAKGAPSSGLLPGIEPGPVGPPGAGDHRVQAYCFRMCMTDNPANRLPFPAPRRYDPLRYELLARVLETGWDQFFRKFDRIPGGKTDTNNHGPVSSDFIGGSHHWPGGGYLERQRIFEEHIEWQCGLYHFVATDPRVPATLRAAFQEWGLAADEFPETGGWPPQLYVREGRRMVSQVVMTSRHCLGLEAVDDPAALGAYQMDSHNCRRYVRPEGGAGNEGDVQVKLPRPYGISCRALVPPPGCPGNLAVACAVSASHIAYGSIRMEPVFMMLGQSAACAMHIALAERCPLQEIPYNELRSELLAAGQVLECDKPVTNQQTGE